MINIRDLVKDRGNIIDGTVARFDYLWDCLSDKPDFYCSNIKDFQDNVGNIGEGRPVLFEKLSYSKKNKEDDKFILKDLTGEVESQLIQDIDIIEAFFDNYSLNSTKKNLSQFNDGKL